MGEQQELSTAARKYATRQWRYKVFMARVHQYIIHLRKAYRGKMDGKERMENPFGDGNIKKQLIPTQLAYADPKDRKGTENISTRRIAEHDEDDPEERKQTEKVRCFIDNIGWSAEECEKWRHHMDRALCTIRPPRWMLRNRSSEKEAPSHEDSLPAKCGGSLQEESQAGSKGECRREG